MNRCRISYLNYLTNPLALNLTDSTQVNGTCLDSDLISMVATVPHVGLWVGLIRSKHLVEGVQSRHIVSGHSCCDGKPLVLVSNCEHMLVRCFTHCWWYRYWSSLFCYFELATPLRHCEVKDYAVTVAYIRTHSNFRAWNSLARKACFLYTFLKVLRVHEGIDSVAWVFVHEVCKLFICFCANTKAFWSPFFSGDWARGDVCASGVERCVAFIDPTHTQQEIAR